MRKAAVKNELTVGADPEQEQPDVQNTPLQELLAASLLFHIIIYRRGIFTVFSDSLRHPISINPQPSTPTQTKSPVKSGFKRKVDVADGNMNKTSPLSKKVEVKTYKAPSTSKRSQTQNFIGPGIKRKTADGEETDQDRKRYQKKLCLSMHCKQEQMDSQWSLTKGQEEGIETILTTARGQVMTGRGSEEAQ